MKQVLFSITLLSTLCTVHANAYPLLSSYAESINGRVMFYQDHQNPTKYWYFSNVIDPVENLDGSVSKPVIRPNYLYFAYTGQAQVRKSDLEEFAATKNIPLTSMVPVPIEKTELTACQNLDASKVTIQIPPRVGSFLEHLPVTIATRDPEAVDILTEALSNGSGVNCYASILYKVAADQHTIHFEVAMDDVFNQFQAAAYGRYWFFEVDLRTNLKNYARQGQIKVVEFKDGDTAQAVTLDANDSSQSTEDMFNQVFDLVIKNLFVRMTKIPEDAALPGASNGALFSLRSNYTRSTEHFSFKGDYAMQGTRNHESLIQIRVAPKR
jgi:hypothetical protein